MVTDNNEDFSLEVKDISPENSADLFVEVFPLNSETVTMGGSPLTPGTAHIHVTEPGLKITGVGSADLTISGSSKVLNSIVNNNLTVSGYATIGDLKLDGPNLSSLNAESLLLTSDTGYVGIGQSNPTSLLHVGDGFTYDDVTKTLFINGTIEALDKSFSIPHPTKEGKRLVYGVLEGPEHAVYIRGKFNGDAIELPEE